MSNLVDIKINGQDYHVPGSMNLIEAAQSVGIHIPNLCYLKGMKGIGACRLCMVEVNGRMGAACTMKTKAGMDIVTDNEKIREIRKFVIDLIISMHPLDCMTCTKAGVCQLQQYAYDFEIKESSFTRKDFKFPVHGANPFLKIDSNYCIMCGRCVRVCKEQGTNVLDFKGRGIDSRIATANDKPLAEVNCTFCGSCLDVCPVNAILEADRWRKGREWHYTKVKSVCLFCGSACEINASKYEGDVVKINAGAPDERTEHFICAVGRYGYDCRKTDKRIGVPVKRVNGKYEETTWEDALQLVADKMKSQESGMIATARMTLNEDALVMKQLSEKAGIQNVSSTVSLYADESSLIGESVDIEEADLIVAVRLNPSQWVRTLPALDAILRKKVARNTKLIVINSEDVKIAEASTMFLKGDEALILKAFAKALIDKGAQCPENLDVSGVQVNEDIDKAAQMYLEAQKPLLLSAPSLFEAASNVAKIKGKSLSISFEANSKGLIQMGITGKGKSYQEMVNGGVKVLYLIGEVPLSERPPVDFLVVQNSHMSDLTATADVVLPSATYLERDGTIIDYQGRLRYVKKVVEPVELAKPHKDILIELAKKMGVEIQSPTEDDVKQHISVGTESQLKPFEKRTSIDISPTIMQEKNSISVRDISRICR